MMVIDVVPSGYGYAGQGHAAHMGRGGSGGSAGGQSHGGSGSGGGRVPSGGGPGAGGPSGREGCSGISLKVGELTDRSESGRGLVRIDTKSMQALAIREGDTVEVEGQRKTGAIAIRAYPADAGLSLIRMDGITRRNAGIGVGETLKVRKAVVKDAKRVVLAPAQKGLRLMVSGELMKRNLLFRPLVKGDILTPFPVVKRRPPRNDMFADIFDMISDLEGLGGGGMGDFTFTPIPGETRLMVVSTNPEGILRVTEETQVEVNQEAVEVEEKTVPSITYEDIGGLRDAVDKIREMVELPLRHPELFRRIGIDPPRGVLLHGPPGTGKTLIAKAVANESGASFFSIAGPEIMSKFYGGSEENLRKVFENAEKSAPSIIFIDEIDAIAPKRGEVTGEVERRVVSTLLTLMDGLKSRGRIIVIAATNRPNAIDEALRRGGRFDREVEIGVPDTIGRKEILQIHTRNMPLDADVKIDEIAAKTYGFVGADLEALAKEAAMSALRSNLPTISWRQEEELDPKVLEKLRVYRKDFENALKMVEPSAMREVMIEVPNVRWEDVGGLSDMKQKLQEMIEWPLKNPESFERLGIRPPSGILLYGPPGCGKTMLVKAVATEAGANFISVKGPEVLTMWVGESERKIREIFRRAKQVAPSVVFFDEIDSIAPRRSHDAGNRVTENVVSQILTEMSGLEDMHNVTVIAATNRPDILDPAILRPGRFDRQVLVPAPDAGAREEIFKVHTKKMPLAKDVDLKKLAKEAEGYSGADIEALVREAGMKAMRDDMNAKSVKLAHFTEALEEVKPSIDAAVIKHYQSLMDAMKARGTKEQAKRERDEVNYVG